MPIKVTIFRNKFAKKALIFTLIACALPLIGSILANVLDPKEGGKSLWAPSFLYLSIAFAAISMFFAIFYGFFIKKNKALFLSGIIGTFALSFIFALVGFLTYSLNNALFLHIGWMIALMAFFYYLGEARNDGTIKARYFGPFIVALLGPGTAFVAFSLKSYSGKDPAAAAASCAQSNLILGIIFFAISAIMMIVTFIMVFAKKIAMQQLGTSKLCYDKKTVDEEQLSSRQAGYGVDKIPTLYDGYVYAFTNMTIERFVDAIKKYKEECIYAINNQIEHFKEYDIKDKQDWDNFVSMTKTWQNNLESDIKGLINFVQKLASHRFLPEIDKGKVFNYDFADCKLDIKKHTNPEERFHIYVGGFSKKFSFHSRTMSASFVVPSYETEQIGYHKKEADHQADVHGYHEPGTPMPEED